MNSTVAQGNGAPLERWGIPLRVAMYGVVLVAFLLFPGAHPVSNWLTAGVFAVWLALDFLLLQWRYGKDRGWWGVFTLAVQMAIVTGLGVWEHDTTFVFALYPLAVDSRISHSARYYWASALLVVAALAAVVWAASPGPGRIFYSNMMLWMGGLLFTLLFAALTRTAVLERARAEQALEELEDARQELSRTVDLRISLAAERERSRVAQEVHDTVAHALTGVHLKLEALRGDVSPDDPGLEVGLLEAGQLVHDALEEMRSAVHEMAASPPLLENFGDAVGALAARMTRMSGVDVGWEQKGSTAYWALEDQHLALRIIREGITNALRHGRATHIMVEFDGESDSIMVAVADDGTAAIPTPVVKGMGLSGIEEAVAKRGGSLQLAAREPRGALLSDRWLLHQEGTES